MRTKKTRLFAVGFALTFIACTVFIVFNPSYGGNSNIISSASLIKSQFNSILSLILSDSSASPISPPPLRISDLMNNRTADLKNRTADLNNQTVDATGFSFNGRDMKNQSGTTNYTKSGVSSAVKNLTWSAESLLGCDVFHGRWVEDEAYPLYEPGSCPLIDESFNCFVNGRPDLKFQKLRWQPFGCNIPRLNGSDMLERLRGKRLVFVGDSLNRNMWESLVCILRNSIADKSRVFEASGRHEFRTEGSYSFIFKDYNCSVEFFRSPFLVQEWEMADAGGRKKETLRLDTIEKSSSRYKDADVIVFNTGHWWTHEKTTNGKDYYQEGNRVYGELKVIEAFQKALSTWARWIDANIDPRRTLVFFRGYSVSHFSGGRWNSGGQCHFETEPIKNTSYLSAYPPKMNVLESVIHSMKTNVSYLNITRMTDYRKDGHPSVYRMKKAMATEDKYQDCSHWCLPGVPDSWNELLYAQLILRLDHKVG
ncbi:protein trichome birefringence-like 1 isoform X2 [Wolffia australiana]